jgi:ABC-2 type transport system permease protein
VTALRGILHKELKIAFTTPVAYVVFFAFALFSSVVFYDQLLQYEQHLQRSRHMDDAELLSLLNFNDVILTHLFANAQIVFVIAVPVLTMRAIAEEKRHKTMELLMTTSISPWQVVLGKYLAYLGVLACLVLILLIYPAILTVFGSNSLVGASVIDWPTTALGLLGVFLTGAMFGAVGFFFSSITESQVVAALLSVFTLLILWRVSTLAADAPGWAGDAIVFLTPITHMTSFVRGVLSAADVLYYVSGSFFFLYLTHRMVEGQRWR